MDYHFHNKPRWHRIMSSHSHVERTPVGDDLGSPDPRRPTHSRLWLESRSLPFVRPNAREVSFGTISGVTLDRLGAARISLIFMDDDKAVGLVLRPAYPANRRFRKRSRPVSRGYTGSSPSSYWKVYGNRSAAKSSTNDP